MFYIMCFIIWQELYLHCIKVFQKINRDNSRRKNLICPKTEDDFAYALKASNDSEVKEVN